SPFGRFLVTVLASLAALEAETTRERTESGKAAAREQGRFLGAAVPFGLATEPHPAGGKRLVPDPDRAAILHEAVDRLDNGQSWYSVTQWLNSTPHRAGKGDWTTQRVRAVLRSKYVQQHLLSAREREIVNRRAAQPLRSGRHATRLLRGLLVCDGCGYRMVVNGQSYTCPSASMGRKCPSWRGIRADPLDQTLTAAWLARYGGMRQPRIVQPGTAWQEQVASARETVTKLRQQLADADRTDRYRVLADLDTAEAELERLETERPSPTPILNDGPPYEALWDAADVEGRRGLLRETLGDTITVGEAYDADRHRMPPLARLDLGTLEKLLGDDDQPATPAAELIARAREFKP